MKLPINLANLKYFIDAVRHESISESAKLNHVSQSAVSQGIAKLGRYFGHSLLEHYPGRFRITAEGKRLFESTQEIFNVIARAECVLTGDTIQTFTFACTYSYALAFLPKILTALQEYLPKVKLISKFGLPDEILDWLRKGKIDFAILVDNPDIVPFEQVELFRGEYKLYTSALHAKQTSLQFIVDSEMRMETSFLQKAYRRHFDRPFPGYMEIRSWEVVAVLAEQGLGIGLLPDYIADVKRYQLQEYPQEYFQCSYTIFALFNDQDKIRQLDNGLLDLLSACHK